MQLTRRRFLKTTLATTAACGLAQTGVAGAQSAANEIIDTHVYLGHWPYEQLSTENPTKLIGDLRRNNISQAWVSSFDGLFHKDIAAVNQRLADACSRPDNEALVPFGTVNPTLPDWEEDVRRCHEVFHMPGIRLHPNYHSYTLNDPRFTRLLELASARGLVVQLVACLGNEKHFLLSPSTTEVNIKPLAGKLAAYKSLRFVLAHVNANASANDGTIQALLEAKHVYFEFAGSSELESIRKLTDEVSPARLVFGSGAPLHSIEQSWSMLKRLSMSSGDRKIIA